MACPRSRGGCGCIAGWCYWESSRVISLNGKTASSPMPRTTRSLWLSSWIRRSIPTSPTGRGTPRIWRSGPNYNRTLWCGSRSKRIPWGPTPNCPSFPAPTTARKYHFIRRVAGRKRKKWSEGTDNMRNGWIRWIIESTGTISWPEFCLLLPNLTNNSSMFKAWMRFWRQCSIFATRIAPYQDRRKPCRYLWK